MGFFSVYSSTSNGIAIEITPPSGAPALVAPAAFTNSSTTLVFDWTQGTSSDPESGIAGYYVQVGTGPGLGNIYQADAGNVLTVSVSTTLAEGSTYYARVRAKNGASAYGDYSDPSSIVVDLTPPAAPSAIESTSHPSTTTAYPASRASFAVSTAGVSDTSGISGFYWIVANASTTAPTSITGTYSSSGAINVSSLASDGTWYFLVVCRDGAGNVGTESLNYKFIVKASIDPVADNTFISADGVKVEIPAGAIATSTRLIIRSSVTAPAPVTDAKLKATNVIRDVQLQDGTKTFAKEITITLPYTNADIVGLNESALKLFFYDETDGYWVLIPNSSVNTTNKSVMGRVNHLTVFRIMEFSTPASALAEISNYPNPFAPLKGETTRIRYSMDQDQEVTIKIFDAFGGLVWEKIYAAGASGGHAGPNEVIWDGKTGDSGRVVAADAYICLLKAGSVKGKRIIGVK